MKFSVKFLLFILAILLFVIATNILALKYFTSQYFGEYVASIKQEAPDINFDLLSAFTNTKKLDDATIAEYKTILGDLSNISRSLESFSQNPRAYAPSIIDSLQKIGVPESSIEHVLFINAINSFIGNLLNFSFLSNTTPEWVFVVHVMRAMFILNIFLILLILAISSLWIRLSFRPILSIIDNLSSVINKREYRSIEYRKKDEFGALISTINLLNTNLSNQEKIRADFLADLSHEIRTPITAIKCYLEGMEDGVIEMTEQNTHHLHREIDRLIEITSSIMEYEKLAGQDRSTLSLDRIDLTEMLEIVREEYSPTLRSHKQKIAFSDGKRFFVRMEHDKCMQLLHNIVSNFTKYAGENTTLTVRTFHKNEESHLIFSDDGRGIPKEEIPFVREKFYQVEKSRSASAKRGIGIGLSIIEKIIEIHGGSLDVSSDAGKGFLLHIVIPKG